MCVHIEGIKREREFHLFTTDQTFCDVANKEYILYNIIHFVTKILFYCYSFYSEIIVGHWQLSTYFMDNWFKWRDYIINFEEYVDILQFFYEGNLVTNHMLKESFNKQLMGALVYFYSDLDTGTCHLSPDRELGEGLWTEDICQNTLHEIKTGLSNRSHKCVKYFFFKFLDFFDPIHQR